jgi:hypothetical protein
MDRPLHLAAHVSEHRADLAVDGAGDEQVTFVQSAVLDEHAG